MQYHQRADWLPWVGFQQTALIGPVQTQMLARAFNGDLEAAWNAPLARLRELLGDRRADSIVATRTTLDLTALAERVETLGQTVLPFLDDRYPALLRETTAPPIVLFVEGELCADDAASIAIVGSRESSPYGRDVTRSLAGELSAAGLTIVSGLARGIDAAAHEAALNAGGRTIAVLAGGTDWIYPSEHRGLAKRITAQGALISEHPPRTRPQPYNFPLRNRIMAGISLGVVIVEAREKSGTLITANYAMHYNREVFAVPGSILSRSSDGCHRLIKDGACLVRDAGDILRELSFNMETSDHAKSAPEATPVPELTGDQALVYAAVSSDPTHVDDLAEAVSRPIADVATALMLLELEGLVRNTGAQHFARIR